MKFYDPARIIRREIILEVYQKLLAVHGPNYFKATRNAHMATRRFFIRPALRAARVSLSPLGFLSKLYPRTFEENMKLWRLRHGTVPLRVGRLQEYDRRMEENRERNTQRARRASRLSTLGHRLYADPKDRQPAGNPEKRITLKALVARYTQEPGVYERVRDEYLEGREVLEALEGVTAQLEYPAQLSK